MAEILRLRLGIAQSDNLRALDLLSSVHPLTTRRYPSDREHNGWVIPRDWIVKRATIRKDGVILFDGTIHPLAVAGYSSSFAGRVDKEELDRHVFSSEVHPHAYPYHCVFNYRPWTKHWGFCVPFAEHATWPKGAYDVDLDVEFRPSEMAVGEYIHQGELPDTVVFNAHTCHACQANDDLSGAMVLVELFRWLQGRKTRYTYRGVLAPEHVGTAFYVADLPPEELATIKLGVFLEMLGTETPLVLQRSFTGTTIIDRVAEHVLRELQPDLLVAPFRRVVGNDETVWEAPGIEVPMISISRWPYPEYHTSEDSLDIISDARLLEALASVQRIVTTLEDDRSFERKFTGLIALSNPRYGLYVERMDPVVHKVLTELDERLGVLQDYLPRLLDAQHTIFTIAERFGVPFEFLARYLERFEEKGLVTLDPVPSLDRYRDLPREPGPFT